MAWVSRTSFYGQNSLRRATELPEGVCAESLNGNLSSSSVAAPAKGYRRFGRQANATNKIVRTYTYVRGDGSEVMLHVRDNDTNYIVEYLNIEDVRNSQDGEWSILETGLSRTYVGNDGNTKAARFDFTPFNDTGVNQLIYGNGVETLRVWNGAVAVIASTTATTVVVSGTATLAQRGFGATTSIIINGNTYTVSSISNQTFTVGSDPTGEAVGSGVAQVVNTSTLSAADPGSILLTALNRLFIAGITATPTEVNFSASGDATTYTDSGNPANGGLEDFPQLNGGITGMSYLDDWIIVGSREKIAAFKYEFPTSTTRIVIRKDIADEGFASHKAIRKLGDQIIYLTPRGGIKRLTQVSAQQVFNVENLTDVIRPTIKNYFWDDGVLEYSSKERLILAAGKSSSDESDNNKMLALFFSTDENGQTILNHGIMDWFVGDMNIYGGNIHFGGSLQSRNYKAFDGYSKDGAPYKWKRVERVEYFGNAWNKKWIKFLGVRGAIGAGTTLKITLKYNINGVINKQQLQLKDSDQYVTKSTLNTLGGFELGSNPLGGSLEELSQLFPFKVKFELPHVYAEDTQLIFETDGTGQIIEIDTYGYEVTSANQHDTQDEIKALGLS